MVVLTTDYLRSSWTNLIVVLRLETIKQTDYSEVGEVCVIMCFCQAILLPPPTTLRNARRMSVCLSVRNFT